MVGNKGAVALATSKSIQHLNLKDNMVGDVGAFALANDPLWIELDISYNYLSEMGISALQENQNIKVLDTSGNTGRPAHFHKSFHR